MDPCGNILFHEWEITRPPNGSQFEYFHIFHDHTIILEIEKEVYVENMEL